MKDLWTVRSLISWTTQYFSENGIVSSRLDSELLLAHALDCRRLDLYLSPDKPVDVKERKRFKEFVKRRAKREPIAYILKKKEFWSRNFYVTPSVLIPRPETEHIIEVVMDRLTNVDHPLIADLGTGSGCIAVTLAAEIKSIKIIATDISEEALRIARQNADTHNVTEKILFLNESWFTKFPAVASAGTFDLIVSNPPYIPIEEIQLLQPEIRFHEPVTALDGGKEGLKPFHQIAEESIKWLKPDGSLVLEIGDKQGDALQKILAENHFESIELVRDLAGKNRIITGRKQCRN